jgi:hypothetical protein
MRYSPYRKRALEDAASSVPPAKRAKTVKEERLERKLKLRAKRSIKATHAQDMSLVTLKNVDKRKVRVTSTPSYQAITVMTFINTRKFWKSTSDGHIIRPIRMRPLHPLPPILIPKAAKQPVVKSNPFRPTKMGTKSTASSKTKKRLVPSRARQTIIDTVRYGSRHLSIPSATDEMPRSRESDSIWEFDDEQQQWVKMSDAGDVLTIEEVRRKATVSLESATPAPIPPVAHTPSKSVVESTIEPRSIARPIVDSSPDSAIGKVQSPQPHILSQPAPRDEISEQLADEQAKGLAIMQSLLANGWAVDLDELEGKHDTGAHANIVLRRASVSGSTSSEQREDEDSEDASPPSIAHARFDDDAAADSESGEDDDDVKAVQVRAAKATSPAKSTTVVGSSASPVATKELRILSPSPQSTPAPATQTQPKSLKEMFAPREDEGAPDTLCMQMFT